jgi:RHS repeat-associated protein
MSRSALAWALCALAILLAAAPALAADTVYYYSSDTLHSEVVVTDQNRNIVERTYYAPYGQVLNRDLRDGPGYTGHEEDPETGLVYMQQRYYDPDAGRFLSTDPVQADGGGGSFNRYAYANDNPYTYDDPLGEAATQATGRLKDAGTSCQTGTHIGGGACGALPLSVTQVGTSSVSEQRAAAVRHAVNIAANAAMVGAIAAGAGPEDPVGDAVGVAARAAIKKYGPVLTMSAIAYGSAAIDDTQVHGNSSRSLRPTEVYYLISRGSGAIDKIGITSFPDRRYSQAYLNAENVDYVTQRQYSSRYPAMLDENIQLTWYLIDHGQLPRLNKVTR